MRFKASFFCFFIIFCIGTMDASATDYCNIQPSGQVGLIENYSANTFRFPKLHFSVSGNFAYDKKLVRELEKEDADFGNDTLYPFAVLYSLFPSLAFGLTDFLDLSIMQPFFFDIIEGFLPSGGPGDFNLYLKCRIPGNEPRLFEGAVLSQLTIANGSRKEGFFTRHSYYFRKEKNPSTGKYDPISFFSAGKPTLSFTGIGTFNRGHLYLHANFGACFTFERVEENAFIGGIGAEWYPANGIGLFAELFAEPRFQNVADGLKITRDPLHISPGVSFHAPGGALLSIGGIFSLASNRVSSYRNDAHDLNLTAQVEPRWRMYLQLGWNGFIRTNDRDKDGVDDRDDPCPDVREDFDDFEDHDGCPDFDNDRDGIPDTLDGCPNDPEDIDGFEDIDGCPDFDNDGDGVVDSLDKCPSDREDKDGFQDVDGCPDPDNDGDRVPDLTDKCPITPEDNDSFEDDDGCPDLDNDLDAIPDSLDKCPDSAGVSEENGCPKPKERAKEIRRGRLILSGVQFEGGSAEPTQGSFDDLDRVYSSLVDWPEVQLEVQAHTDNSLSAEASLALSKKRAEAVRDYLIGKGIAPIRLVAVGKGSDEPIADNGTIQGRRLNSRIEIHRKD